MRHQWRSLLAATAVVAAAAACSSSGTLGGSAGGTASGGSTTGGSATSGSTGGVASGALGKLSGLSALDAVKATSAAASSKPSAKIHMVMATPTMDITADGAMRFKPAAADMTMEMSSGSASMQQALAAMGGQIEVRMTGSVMYMKMGDSPQLQAALQGKQWMKMDLTKLSQVPALSSMSFLGDMTKQDDPAQQLKSVLASPDLKKIGTEQHNGVQSLHYAGTVSADAMISMNQAASAGLTKQDLDTMRQVMRTAGITSTHYDLWVDAAGLPVELKFDEQSKMGDITGDLSYSDWGAPVTVAAPPADQTTDMLQLMNGAG